MTSDSNERRELTEALVSWLERERIAALESSLGKETTLTKRVQRVFAKRTHTSSDRTGEWSLVHTHHESEEVSGLHGVFPKYVSPRWTPTSGSPLQTGNESDEMREKRESVDKRLLGDYLTGLERLTEADVALARRLTNDYLDWLFATDVTEVEEVPIGGIIPPDAAVLSSDGTLCVRALTPEELGENLRRMMGLDRFVPDNEMPPFGTFFESIYSFHEYMMGSMVTVRRSVARKTALESDAYLPRAVLAFQLLDFAIFGRGVAPRWTEPGPKFGDVAPELLELPKYPEFEERPITQGALDDVISLANTVPRTFSKATQRHEVALHQFSGACAQKSAADAIIGFTIALEALFVPGLAGENGYRFRLNGARYLGSTEIERREIYSDLKDLYALRSQLVHGGPARERELRDARMIARSLTGRALRKALKEGWPTATVFEDSALS